MFRILKTQKVRVGASAEFHCYGLREVLFMYLCISMHEHSGGKIYPFLNEAVIQNIFVGEYWLHCC